MNSTAERRAANAAKGDTHELRAFYREKATEAEDRAAKATDYQTKQLILQVAQTWRVLERSVSRRG